MTEHINNQIFVEFVKRRIRDNKNFIGIFCGQTGCFSKDTILYGQTKSVEELYQSGNKFINTFSLNKAKNVSGTYYPVRSKSEIIFSGKKELFEIELDNGKKILASKDHTFFRRNKHIFEEVKLQNLNIGDELRDYDISYLEKFYFNANKRSKDKITKSFLNNKKCISCNNLFYFNRGRGLNNKNQCGICFQLKKELKIKIHKSKWFGWEDNLLRQYYYDCDKNLLLSLLKRTWSSIEKRALRLGLKRAMIKRYEKNAFSSENNPIYNPISRMKMMNKIAPIFSRKKMTSIEKKIAEILDKNNIKYEFNKTIITKTTFRIPDFKIGNTLIECDGIYWHKDRNDKKRDEELKEQGFEIIRFTDIEINNNLNGVEKCIIQKLNQ